MEPTPRVGIQCDEASGVSGEFVPIGGEIVFDRIDKMNKIQPQVF